MALEAYLAVTQPYHGPGGELLFDVGYRFGLDADLPEGIRTAPVIAEAPEPDQAQDTIPAPEPAKPAAKAAKAEA
jgi:hypothetical protein